MTPDDSPYDVIIIGGGPAGLAAGIYAARDRYKALLLEKNGLVGGQIMLTERVENYPGIPQVTGPDLIESMRQQVTDFGAPIQTGREVTSMSRNGNGLIEIVTDDGGTYQTRAVVLAPGSDYRKLDVPGEDELRQVGKVSYCATCDGAFYRDKHVLAIGGGNTAVEDSIYLATRFTRKVTLVHRRKEFRAQKVLVEELYLQAHEGKVEIKLPYVVDRIVPDSSGEQIDHVLMCNVETGKQEKMHVDGVFVFVGMIPNTGWLRGIVEMDDQGYIACDCTTLKTSMPGVFVAGDCRQRAAMQLATAVSDGVLAAMGLKQYFRDKDTWQQTMPEEGLVKGW